MICTAWAAYRRIWIRVFYFAVDLNMAMQINTDQWLTPTPWWHQRPFQRTTHICSDIMQISAWKTFPPNASQTDQRTEYLYEADYQTPRRTLLGRFQSDLCHLSFKHLACLPTYPGVPHAVDITLPVSSILDRPKSLIMILESSSML